MKHLSKLIGASLLLIALSIPQSAISADRSVKVLGKMMAEVECRGTEEKLVYDCMITLKDSKTGKKLRRLNSR